LGERKKMNDTLSLGENPFFEISRTTEEGKRDGKKLGFKNHRNGDGKGGHIASSIRRKSLQDDERGGK